MSHSGSRRLSIVVIVVFSACLAGLQRVVAQQRQMPPNEIDYLEARGQEPSKYQTNYFYGKAANRNLVRNAVGYINTDVDLTACYHVYEMVWAQNTLSSYFDGVLVETKSGGYISNLFGKTERITLNLAVGGNFFANLDPTQIQPGTMYVDYVKVFTSK